MLASSLLVNAFSGRGRKVRWDYEEESPLRDARGFEAAREPETPAEDDLGLANVILTNGARYYVDHAHPEYSSPDADPRTLVAYDKAGERILAESARRAAELARRPAHPGLQEQHRRQGHLLRHPRELPGRPGDPVRPDRPRPDPVPGQPPGVRRRGSLVRDHHDGSVAFQIAQRSQFFEVEVGLETTLKRPIVNTRDEPHADPERYRRLHVIIGDANMNEVATFLKTGSLAIVLNMIEDGVVPGDEWQLANPVQALRAIAKDPTLRTTGRAQGRPPPDRLRAPVALPGRGQDLPQGPRRQPLAGRGPGALGGGAGPARGRPPEGGPDRRLGDQVPAHAADRRPRRSAVGGRQARPGRPPVPRRPHGQGPLLPAGRRRPGRAHGRRAGDHHRGRAPPTPGRSSAAAAWPTTPQIAAAGWDAIIFDIGRETLQRVPMLEPTQGTAAHTAAVLDASPTAEDLIRNLQS